MADNNLMNKSYFSINELLPKCTTLEKETLLSNKDLCGNLSKLYITLNLIRYVYGGKITVNSGYRDASHNRRVGGSATSQHMRAQAADIQPTADQDNPDRQTNFTKLIAAIQKCLHYEYIGQVIIYIRYSRIAFIHVANTCDKHPHLAWYINEGGKTTATTYTAIETRFNIK